MFGDRGDRTAAGQRSHQHRTAHEQGEQSRIQKGNGDHTLTGMTGKGLMDRGWAELRLRHQPAYYG